MSFAVSTDLPELKWGSTLVFKKAFSLLCPTYQTGTEYLSHTVRSPLLWNHKAENHHPSDIFRWGNSGDNSWLSWHLELGRLRLGDRTVVGWESRGSREQVLLSWRGSALSVTAAVWLALVGTDVWWNPYISLYTLHGGESLKIEDNNMHGGLFKEEM